VDFDWDQMLSFDGETGPYLMYTHTRLASVLKKYANQASAQSDYKLLNQPDEITLIKRLEEFPDTIRKSADENEPSIISNYLLNISSVFNRYYHYHRIISDDAVLTSARIDLCKRLKYVLQQGITLLGITPIEEM
jgi:arginyl-tRNA synthetase